MTRFKLTISSCAACLSLLATAGPAMGAAFEVNDPGDGADVKPGDTVCEATPATGDCTLRAAIDEANSNLADADDVTFTAGLGTISPVRPLKVTGPIAIDGNGSSGAGSTVIDGGDLVQLLGVSSTADPVAFADLRLEDGSVTGDGGGAGIRTDANTTLTNVVVTSSSISGMTADGHGAGVFNSNSAATLTIEDSAITDNTITTASGIGATGAGIASAGSLSLTDTTVSGNKIIDGGGTFAQGGGIRADAGLSLLRSTLSGNSVDGLGAEGGGIFNGSNSGARSIVNSTISGNSAPSTGAGGAELGEDATITNATFADDAGGSGSGADLILYGKDTAVTAQNTIFGSTGACGAKDGAVLGGTNNIDVGKSCGLSGAGNQQSTDPLLGALALNAPGSTMTHSIALGSPALDAADTGCGDGLVTDQRGFARSQGGPRCDVGSFEAQHHLLTVSQSGSGSGVVTATGIGCGGDCSESYVQGTTVIVTETPASDSTFSSWSGCDSSAGDQCTVTLSGDRMVLASFALTPVTPPPGGGGTVIEPATPNKCKKGFKRVAGKCKRVKKKRK